MVETSEVRATVSVAGATVVDSSEVCGSVTSFTDISVVVVVICAVCRM